MHPPTHILPHYTFAFFKNLQKAPNLMDSSGSYSPQWKIIHHPLILEVLNWDYIEKEVREINES